MSNQKGGTQSYRAYFELLERVGAYGPYQRKSLIILCFVSMLGASSFFINPFLFHQNSYQCPPSVATNCQAFVCSLPTKQRQQYLNLRYQMITLGNIFGDMHCQKMGQLTAMQTALIFGSFFGIIIGILVSELFGRKMTIVYTIQTAIVGLLIIMVSNGTTLACIGLFIFGTGAEIYFTMVFTVITEIVDEQHRSKYYVYLLLFFGFGAMGNSVAFYFLNHYEWVLFIYYLIPNAAVLYIFARYVQDTPIQLVTRYSPEEAFQSFLFIAKENGNLNHGITCQELNAIQEDYRQNQKKKSHQQNFTIIDLFRYKSVRSDLLRLSFHFFILMFQLYAPILLSNYLNMNIFTDSVINGISQIVTVPVLLSITTTLPRRKGQVMFMALTFCFSAVLYLMQPERCEDCYHGIYGVFLAIFFFLYRFSANLSSNFFANTEQEAFSAQVRPIGVFFIVAVGRSSSLSIPYLYLLRNQYDISLMSVFTIGALIGILSGWMLRETVGIPPCEFIKELQPQEHHTYRRL